MLLDAEAKAASVAEVPPQELVFLDLQAALNKLHCLLAPHRHVTSNLLVTPDPERPNRVASLGKDRALAAKLLQNLKNNKDGKK